MRNMLLFFLFITSALFSQTKLNIKKYEKPLLMPRKYSTISDELDISVSDQFSHDLWIVLSDRDSNKTYTKADSTSDVHSTINFLDAFYVAAEDNEFILLAKADLKRGRFHKNVESYGWIHKSKMILSKHSLKDENQIYRKALVINSINQIEQILNRDNMNSLLYRKGPSSQYAEKDTSRVFNIYFVLKTNRTNTDKPTMYLLARKSLLYSVGNLETIQSANNGIILGWIPATSITPWNHRIALEQNWELKAVKERKERKFPAQIYLDEEKFREQINLNHAQSISEDSIVLLDEDPYFETNLSLLGKTEDFQAESLKEMRLDGYNMRYPIVEDYGDGLYSVGFIGDVYISRLRKLSAIQEAKGQKILQEIKQKYQYTNIVFVVDATNSMTPYLKTVSKAIQSAMQNLSQKGNIKFGGVIYRDGDDEIPPTKELTNQYWEVASYFQEQNGMSRQPSFAESMYRGILQGLEETGFREGENNCIVVISDVGNHQVKEISKEKKIASLLTKYNCNYLAIQVNRKSRYPQEKQANDDFYLQNSRIIETAISQSAKQLGTDSPTIPKAGLVANSTQDYTAIGPLFLGKVLPIEVGTPMEQITLEKYILTFIHSAEKNSEIVLKNLDDIAQGKGIQQDSIEQSGKGSDISRNDLSKLTLNMMKLADLDLNIIDNIKEKRFQLYVNGLIKNKFELPDGSFSQPLFKKVILISANDMRRLHTIFGECFNDDFRIGEPENIRLAEGWREFIGKLSGNFSPEQQEKLEEFNQKTIAELTEISFGIPSDSKFATYSLEDILELDPYQTDDREIIDQLKHHIREKYEILDQKVLNKGDQYKFSFYIDDVLYYWISADDLP